MPFALTFVGLLLIITGFQNTYKEFGSQVQKDFTGPGNFLYWMVAILVVGSLGYIKGLEKFSRLFMALIIVGILLSKKSGTAQGINFFSGIGAALNSGTTSAVNAVGAPVAGASGGTASGSGGFDLSSFGDLGSIADEAVSFF